VKGKAWIIAEEPKSPEGIYGHVKG